MRFLLGPGRKGFHSCLPSAARHGAGVKMPTVVGGDAGEGNVNG